MMLKEDVMKLIIKVFLLVFFVFVMFYFEKDVILIVYVFLIGDLKKK